VKLPVIGDGYRRNTSLIEYPGFNGSFRNTTVRGAVTGEGLDLGFIDDPLKGREEASSAGIRDKTWDWFTDDFFTRFSEKAGLLFVMTRWHIDDPLGRMEALKEDFPELKLVRYPAIAETDEPHRKAGEALFPEHKSLEFINKRRRVMTEGHFQSLYQGRPTVEGGTLFPVDRFVRANYQPLPQDILRTIRYWDKAGTHGGGAYTAGVLMHLMKDGRICVSHVYRKQVNAWDRERDMKALAQADIIRYPRMTIGIEQEPGSGGKESAQRTIANLAGFSVKADRPVGDKELRAEPYAAQVQGGNVILCEGEWTQAFIDEHEVFPNGVYKDQVDAAAGAYGLLAKKRYEDDGPIFGPKVIRA
jgi:predicted phage terminase large subunit-like protein